MLAAAPRTARFALVMRCSMRFNFYPWPPEKASSHWRRGMGASNYRKGEGAGSCPSSNFGLSENVLLVR